jgi:hypothetical protein
VLCLFPLCIACRCKPSVVHIASLGDAGSYYSLLQLDPERVPLGMGSGFMWDKEVRRQLSCYLTVTLLLRLYYICYFQTFSAQLSPDKVASTCTCLTLASII